MGSLIYAEGEFYQIPAYPPRDVVDATGCGDTYMAGYLYKKSQGATYYDAGCYAAAMCTLKLEASGPFSASEADILAVVSGKTA
jgi:sugar/nucleoside kinase (ribokinase family)